MLSIQKKSKLSQLVVNHRTLYPTPTIHTVDPWALSWTSCPFQNAVYVYNLIIFPCTLNWKENMCLKKTLNNLGGP